MSRLGQILRFLSRTGIPILLLGLHILIFACYARRWDRVAALTILPIWAWAAVAVLLCLISWLIHRGKGAYWVGILWILTAMFMSEEPRFLLRWVKEAPQPGPPADFQGTKVLRVVNLNCRRMNPVAAKEVAQWKPDIVMLQEAPSPVYLNELKKELFSTAGDWSGDWVGAYDCSILTRGHFAMKPTNFVTSMLPAIVEIDGKKINLVCVHLQGAITDLSLFSFDTWLRHYYNRQSRRYEVGQVRNRLAVTRALYDGPVIMAGDFNAPSDDAVMREIRMDFTDAIEAAGSGISNTYPNHFPVHRIDHVFSNGRCQPVRATTVKTVNSDHRMVVVDYVLP